MYMIEFKAVCHITSVLSRLSRLLITQNRAQMFAGMSKQVPIIEHIRLLHTLDQQV